MILLRTVLLLLAVVVTQSAMAADCAEHQTVIEVIQGEIQRQINGESWSETLVRGDISCLNVGDHLVSEERAAIRLAENAPMRLGANSITTLQPKDEYDTVWLQLFRGMLYIIDRLEGRVGVETPYTKSKADGTEFQIILDKAASITSVLEGQVRVSNVLGELLLHANESAIATENQAPRPYLQVSPQNAVQWTIYYPALVDWQTVYSVSLPRHPGLDRAIEQYRNGASAKALKSMGSVPPAAQDERYFTLKITLLLTLGRIEQANTTIHEMEQSEPTSATVAAYLAIIAVAQNRVKESLTQAQIAVDLEPQSAVAYTALSYAQQADFQLKQALKSAQTATHLAPHNALALARRSELELMSGDTSSALITALQAEQLAPKLSRTHSVTGFANLANFNLHQALSRFETAIKLDDTDPLPRLGRGLALIRLGDLSSGSAELELAVLLDPANSLFRSYLAKAYFDARQFPQANNQIEIAKSLDPLDPTPWLYSAIFKYHQNQPIDAIRQLRQSIALNGNRAVYRSRLLLDKDEAIRSTSLARLYHELGFEHQALAAGTSALNLDPANRATHTFLSDLFSNQRGQRSRRWSERLQARLLGPPVALPEPPEFQLKSALSPVTDHASPGYNEYGSLFERESARADLTLFGGNRDMAGDQAIIWGLSNKTAYSFGQYHIATDGFRPQADVRHDIYNAQLQHQFTTGATVHLDGAHRKSTIGDLRQTLDPEFTPNLRRELDSQHLRLGFHHQFSVDNNLIGFLLQGQRDEKIVDLNGPITEDSRDGDQIELRYLTGHAGSNISTGISAYRVNASTGTRFELDLPPGFPQPEPVITESQIDGGNFYSYAQLPNTANLHATVGLSYDLYKDKDSNLKLAKLNPKLGLQWPLSDSIDLRLAYFQTLDRQLLVDQTLEPTTIAGFNQFYDDFNGSRARFAGMAFDQQFSDTVFASLAFSDRKIRLQSERDEKLASAVINWAVNERWALSANYRAEREEADNLKIKTKIAPLSLAWYYNKHINVKLTGTWVKQRNHLCAACETANFNLLDLFLRYQWPTYKASLGLQVKNLLDKDFLFQDNAYKAHDRFDIDHPFVPGRTAFLTFSVYLN